MRANTTENGRGSTPRRGGRLFPIVGKSAGPFSNRWKICFAVLSALLVLPGVRLDVAAQDLLYNRNDSGTAMWRHDDNKPWWRSSDEWTLARPDIEGQDLGNTGHPNHLFYNHNNYTACDVNGQWWPVQSLTFQDGCTSSRTFTYNGLDLYSKIENQSSGHHVFYSGISLQADGEFVPLAGDLTFSDVYKNDHILRVYGGAGRTLTVSNLCHGGYLSIDEDQVVRGTIVKIRGIGDHSGPTYINQGELRFQAGGAFGPAGVINVGNGAGGFYATNSAGLWLETAGIALTNPLQVNAGSEGYRVVGGLNTSGTAYFHGAVNLLGPVFFTAAESGGTVAFTHVISGAETLHKAGPGTVVLSGENTHTGTNVIRAGTLQINADRNLGAVPAAVIKNVDLWEAAAFEVNGTFTLHSNREIYVGAVSGPKISVTAGNTLTCAAPITGTAGWSKIGIGRLALAGSNAFSGELVISSGVVRVQQAYGLGSTAAGVTVESGAALEIQGSITSAAEPVTLKGRGVSGGGALANVTNPNTISGSITLGADAEIQVTENTLNLSGGLALSNRTLYVDVQGTALDMTAGNCTGGTRTDGDGAIRKAGTGRFGLRGGSELTGNVYVDEGELRLMLTGDQLPAGGVLHLSNNVTLAQQTAHSTAGKAVNIYGNITLGRVAAGSVTLTNTVDLQGGMRTVSSYGNMYISGPIANGGLTKSGSGKLVLSGQNAYAGGTVISEGSLQIGNNGTVGTIVGAVTDNASLIFLRSDNHAFSGSISGTGMVSQLGGGTLTLSGANSYSGGTVISNGVLKISADGNLGNETGFVKIGNWAALHITENLTLNASRAITVSNGHITVDVDKTAAFGGVLSGNRQFNKAGWGRLNLSGSSVLSGPVHLQEGILAIGADANLGAAPASYVVNQLVFTNNHFTTLRITNSFELNARRGVQLAAHAILHVEDGVTFTNHGIISEAGGARNLTKAGGGTVSLGGTNTFTGNLYVDEGVVELGGDDPLDADWTYVGMESGSAAAALYARNGLSYDEQIEYRTGSSATHLLGMREAGTALFGCPVKVSGNMAVSNCAGSVLRIQEMWQEGDDKAFRKIGAGVFVLDTNYVKHITNEVGTLRAGSSDGWKNWTHVYLAGGSTFDLDGHSVTQQWVDGAGSVTLAGGHLVIDGGNGATLDGVISGSGQVTKTGADIWRLDGENTFEGKTFIEGGRLAVDRDGNLGVAPVTAEADRLNIGHWGALLVTNAMALNANRGILLHAGEGGAIEVAGEHIVMTNCGIISGEGRWFGKTGSGTMLLIATNLYSGGTVISGGTVQVRSDVNLGEAPSTPQENLLLAEWGTLRFSPAGGTSNVTLNANRTLTIKNGHLRVDGEGTNLTYAGRITGSGQLNITGGGRVNLSGNSDYTGKTEIQWGSLAIGADANLGSAPAVATPGHLAFNGQDWAHLFITNSMTLNAHRGLSLSNVNAIIEVADAGHELTYNGIIDGTDHGGALAKRGAGRMTLGGQSVFTNNIYVDSGSLKLTAPAPAAPLASKWIDLGTTNADQSSPSVYLVLGPGVQIANKIHARTNAYFATGDRYIAMEEAGESVLSGEIRLSDMLVVDAVGGSTLTFSGNFWQNDTDEFTGPQQVSKQGEGTMVLGNTNNWFKYFYVNEGTAKSGVNGALWAWTDLTISNGALYDMDGKNLQVPVLEGAGELKLGAGTMTLFNGYDRAFYGTVSGSGNLIKSGDTQNDMGRLALYGANEYSGTTMVYYGTLWVDNQTNLGCGNLAFNNNARLWLRENSIFDSSRSVRLAGDGNIEVYNEAVVEIRGVISGIGTLNKGDGGVLVLTNDNTMSGAVCINKGTLSVPKLTAAGMAQPLGMKSSGGVPHVYVGSVGEEGRLLYTGSGGSTTKNFHFPENATGVISIAAGATLTNAPGSEISGSGLFRKQGAGTLFFNQTAPNTLSGRVFVDEGNLRLRRYGALGNTTQTVVSAGASLVIDSDGANYAFQTGELLLNGYGVEGGGALRVLQNRANNSVINDIHLEGDTALYYGGETETFYITNATVSGEGRLIKSGPGLIHLDGTNTYSGGTTISNGTIRFLRTENLGAEPSVYEPDHIVLNGGSLQKMDAGAMTATLSANRGVTLGMSGGKISVNSADRTLLLEAPLTGAGPLTKELAGVLRLDADSSATYSGVIEVRGGTLEVRGSVANSPLTVTNAILSGSGSVGSLLAQGGSTLSPGDAENVMANLYCSALSLENGAGVSIPVSSGEGATNGMLWVEGDMALPSSDSKITVELSYQGSGTNYFRRIPFLHFTGSAHSTPHTNWNVTGVPANLKPFMTVMCSNSVGGSTYYVEGATPHCEITNSTQNATDVLEIDIEVDTVVGLDYDLIYFDAVTYPSGSGAAAVEWKKLYSMTAINTSTLFTNDLTDLPPGYLRFMRISPMGAWQNDAGSKFASRQIYVAQKSVLYPGRNWVSLPGVPIHATVSNVFGYGLPAGGQKALSTWIDLYRSGGSISPTGTFWLADAPAKHWEWSLGGSQSADHFELPITQGFMVNIPEGAEVQYLALAGLLRTNEESVVIGGGKAMTFVSVLLPGFMHPKELGLVESGFSGNSRPNNCDLLYVWDRTTQGLKSYRPMWYNIANSSWYWQGGLQGGSSVKVRDSEHPISQDDALIIYRHGPAGFTWKNPIYYTPPTADMAP